MDSRQWQRVGYDYLAKIKCSYRVGACEHPEKVTFVFSLKTSWFYTVNISDTTEDTYITIFTILCHNTSHYHLNPKYTYYYNMSTEHMHVLTTGMCLCITLHTNRIYSIIYVYIYIRMYITKNSTDKNIYMYLLVLLDKEIWTVESSRI